jgi:hypothetical protein
LASRLVSETFSKTSAATPTWTNNLPQLNHNLTLTLPAWTRMPHPSQSDAMCERFALRAIPFRWAIPEPCNPTQCSFRTWKLGGADDPSIRTQKHDQPTTCAASPFLSGIGRRALGWSGALPVHKPRELPRCHISSCCFRSYGLKARDIGCGAGSAMPLLASRFWPSE